MSNPGRFFCRRVSLLTHLFLIALCLSLSGNLAFGALLGKPPTFPQSLMGLELPAQEKAPGGIEVAAAVPLSVNPKNREASRQFFLNYYLNADTPDILWTGNRATCVEGTTSVFFRDAVLLRLNYFRAMAGVPTLLGFSDTYSVKDQEAALMMSVNGALNHDPPTTWTCYTDAGNEAAGNSNLGLGAYGWEVVSLYIADPGTNNGAVGHRRWIFYPQTQYMGTGDLPPDVTNYTIWSSNALWVIDENIWGPRPATRDNYVAWPPPGYVPYQVVYPRWSFSYPEADFSGAAVTMTQNGATVPVVQETVALFMGENTLVWIPNGMSSEDSWPQPASDTKYRVTLSNVVIAGSPQTFAYDVTVFDPAVPSIQALPCLPLLLD